MKSKPTLVYGLILSLAMGMFVTYLVVRLAPFDSVQKVDIATKPILPIQITDDDAFNWEITVIVRRQMSPDDAFARLSIKPARFKRGQEQIQVYFVFRWKDDERWPQFPAPSGRFPYVAMMIWSRDALDFSDIAEFGIAWDLEGNVIPFCYRKDYF